MQRGTELNVIAARPNSGRPYTAQEFFDSPFYMPGPVVMWHYNKPTRSTGHSLIGLTRIQTHRFNPVVHKYYVLCQGVEGYSASYHRTRAEARAARKKMQANPFMQWDSIQLYPI